MDILMFCFPVLGLSKPTYKVSCFEDNKKEKPGTFAELS
jgi:hypothetical protein